MSHTIYTAYAGLKSRADALEVVGNNLANIQSAGFKKKAFYFEMLDRLQDSNLTPLGSAINGPIVKAYSGNNFSNGSLNETGNPLDLALTGDGFFAVNTPWGIRYTRNGHFSLNEKGELTNQDGYPVVGQERPDRAIMLPPGQIEVSPNGQISVDGIVSGRVKVVTFENLASLEPVGASLFVARNGAVERPSNDLNVAQGFLEGANVNPIEGITQMITLMRSFEMLTNVIRSFSRDVDQRMISEVGRVRE